MSRHHNPGDLAFRLGLLRLDAVHIFREGLDCRQGKQKWAYLSCSFSDVLCSGVPGNVVLRPAWSEI